MKRKELFVDTGEFFELISSQLSGIRNIELLILKGHILIEYALNKYIDSISDYDKSIEDTRFTFSHKVDICKMLGLLTTDESDNLEAQINLFNKLRNQIAHTLTFDKKILENLFKYHPAEETEFKNHKEATKHLLILRGIIPWICGNIIGRLEVMQRLKQSITVDQIDKIREELNK